MTDLESYYEYLRGRSIKGLLYRKFFLYPRLARHLNGRVLDIGCGIGDFLAFRRRTIGVDVNPKLIAYCTERGLEAYEMPHDRLPFEDASFDGAILDNVLEHIADPQPLLAEARRVIKPGGTFIVGVPGAAGYESDPDHKVNYDETTLCESVRKPGFTATKIFHMPLRCEYLDRQMKQYCIYGVFR
jgi:SAM-dependent methyltransferase